MDLIRSDLLDSDSIISYKVYKDFPKEGIEFIDLSPSLLYSEVYASIEADLCSAINQCFNPLDIDLVIAPESRGFLYASLVARNYDYGLIPMRKEGKLPNGVGVEYEKEYGKDKLYIPNMQSESNPEENFYKGKNVLFIDDIYATGGTYKAAKDLCKMVDANLIGGVVVATILDEWKKEPNLYSLYHAE